MTSYWAKSQATFLKEQEAKTRAESDKKANGPRRLDALQEQKIGFVVKEAGLSILLIAVNDAEAKAYAIQIGHALEAADVPLIPSL